MTDADFDQFFGIAVAEEEGEHAFFKKARDAVEELMHGGHEALGAGHLQQLAQLPRLLRQPRCRRVGVGGGVGHRTGWNINRFARSRRASYSGVSLIANSPCSS